MEQALNTVPDKWWEPGFLPLEQEVTGKQKDYNIHGTMNQAGDITINYCTNNCMEQALNTVCDKQWEPGFLPLEQEVTDRKKDYNIHGTMDQAGDITVNYL